MADAVSYFVDQMTIATGVVSQQVVADTSKYRLSELLPTQTRTSHKVIHTVLDPYGGSTKDHVQGTQPQQIQTPGYKAIEYIAPYFKEYLNITSKHIMFLRNAYESGKNLDERGIKQYVAIVNKYLKSRQDVKMELLRSQAIFDGQFDYLGQTYTYGRPPENTILPVHGSWLLAGSGDPAFVPNPNAKPLQDIRQWFGGAFKKLRKYKFKSMMMNPVTANALLESNDTKTYITSVYANPAFTEYELNKVIQMQVVGAPIVEVNDTIYLDQADVPLPDGSLDVSDGKFIIPDGQILFVIDKSILELNDNYGEFSLTLNETGSFSGSARAPNKNVIGTVPECGPYILMVDKTAPELDGDINPHIRISSAFAGAPSITRIKDVFIANVLPTP